jgi:hypothetical protein
MPGWIVEDEAGPVLWRPPSSPTKPTAAKTCASCATVEVGRVRRSSITARSPNFRAAHPFQTWTGSEHEHPRVPHSIETRQLICPHEIRHDDRIDFHPVRLCLSLDPEFLLVHPRIPQGVHSGSEWRQDLFLRAVRFPAVASQAPPLSIRYQLLGKTPENTRIN